MNGEKLGEQYHYIDIINYDKFDSRTSILYGNGTYSEYYYDPLNRRLKNLKSYDASGQKMHDIDYGYDGVGNILHQSNNGEYVYNGAGGPYNYHYEYDELYRLIQSEGNFESNNNGNMYYNLNMSYSPSGNITNKQLYGQTLINGGVNNIDYNRDYQYNGRPHQITNVGENEYEWDGNGNMIFRNTPHGIRYQCWDNEDRLVAVHDEGEMPQISAYLYDGGGERVWKLTGGVIQNYMNGQQIYSSGHLDKTLYASPYMVMTEKEYTKHYYIEGERICSKIGSGFQGAHTPPTSHPIDFIAGSAHICSMQLREMVGRNVRCASYNGDIDIDPKLPPAHNDGNEYEKLQYFYHSDHLGSASFVTNIEGAVMQHLQYLPYGELFVSQRNSEEFDSRYKFTAKELDNETSYTYFGARYYDSDLSVWLSVDPMSDERSWVSPYNYCQWNPIIMVDPNGKIDGWVEGPDGNVFWDPNTNSQEEFNKNYAGKEGYSYASDPDDPRSYTLPTGEGKVIMHQWIEHDIEDGLGGPMIKMEFKPTDNNSNVGWFQTFESNIPDVSSSDCYFKLPDENIVERLDGQYIMNKSDIKQATYFDNPPSTILEDQPGRFYKEGAKYSVYWKAQSSIIINGKRSFTISWGFTIDSKNSGTYIRPNFVKEPTEFHKNAINYLKFN